MRTEDRIEYASFRILTGILGGLPSGSSRRLGRGLGRVAGDLLRVRRAVVVRQLAAIYPDLDAPSLQRVAGDMYRHLGEMVAEIFAVPPEELASQVAIEPGWGGLDEAMAAGRGVIAVTAHLGNFELGGRVLARRYPVLDVVKPMRNPLFDAYLRRMRNRHGIATVDMDASGRRAVSHLRGGGLLTLLVDQDAGNEGLVVPFLGRPASTWPGAARLALGTGAAVVPVAITRQPDGRHVFRIGTALDQPATGDRRADVLALTDQISEAVGREIHRCPEQWFWVHRRWKSAPSEGENHAA